MFDWTRCLKLFSFSLSPALVFCISCKRCTCATSCRQAAVNLLFFFTQPKKCNNGNIIKGNSWQKCRPHSKALTATQQTIQLLFHEVLGRRLDLPVQGVRRRGGPLHPSPPGIVITCVGLVILFFLLLVVGSLCFTPSRKSALVFPPIGKKSCSSLPVRGYLMSR